MVKNDTSYQILKLNKLREIIEEIESMVDNEAKQDLLIMANTYLTKWTKQ